MQCHSLRSLLRTETQADHRRIDNLSEIFLNREQYKDFALKSYRFRVSLEPALDSFGLWRPQKLAPYLCKDLKDLGLSPPSDVGPPPPSTTTADHIGALYVLEGSALGARLLMRRASDLGLSAEFGARHLAQQTADPNRWTNFVSLIETVPQELHSQVVTAAKRIFAHAYEIYKEPADAKH